MLTSAVEIAPLPPHQQLSANWDPLPLKTADVVYGRPIIENSTLREDPLYNEFAQKFVFELLAPSYSPNNPQIAQVFLFALSYLMLLFVGRSSIALFLQSHYLERCYFYLEPKPWLCETLGNAYLNPHDLIVAPHASSPYLNVIIQLLAVAREYKKYQCTTLRCSLTQSTAFGL